MTQKENFDQKNNNNYLFLTRNIIDLGIIIDLKGAMSHYFRVFKGNL